MVGVLLISVLTIKAQNYESIVFKELLRNKVDSSTARIIVAIGRHESATFSSKLFRDAKNVFGMTYPVKRKTSNTGYVVMSDHGHKRKFCKFKTTTSSTTDFVYYLSSRDIDYSVPYTAEEFVKTLKKKKYFEASEIVYLRAVKRHLKELQL